MKNKILQNKNYCFENNDDFCIMEPSAEESFAVIRKDDDSPELRNLLALPLGYMNIAKIIKDSRTTKAGIITLRNGKKLFIKRHNNKGVRYTLKYVFRRSRAFRSWRSVNYMEACGLPVPHHKAAMAVRHYGILKYGYLVSEIVENLVPTVDFFHMIMKDKDLNNFYIDHTAKLISELHNCGIIHGDLKLSNIFIRKNKKTEKYSFGFWDLDSVKFGRKNISMHLREKEISKFISSYIYLGIFEEYALTAGNCAEKLIEKYNKHSGLSLNTSAVLKSVSNYLKSHHKITC